ncbi:MAG: wax ester/triacylglycerol synthase family O-acyltransferase [Burkholderiaceae bacterium]|nr:wax ester/triacylglycerol synthase family O-acyltransferase [Burkholderiaceae bacterium]
MTPLSGLDGAFLHLETEATPMHVASLHRFDPPAGKKRFDFLAEMRRQLRGRLSLAPVLTRRLAPMPLQFANPVWVEDPAVDVDQHVTGLRLPAPGGQRELEDAVAGLHAQLLDRSRPLWQVTVIDGLASGQLAYYVKIHHALLDGQAGVMLAQVLFDVTAKPAPRPRRRAAKAGAGEGGGTATTALAPGEAASPGPLALAGAALKHDAAQYIKLLRHLPEVVTTLAGLLGVGGAGGGRRAIAATAAAEATASSAEARSRPGRAFGPRTPLNVPITAERTFAGVSLPLEALEALAAQHEAKLNDIVLALCSGALRRYLARHGGVPRKPLVATMPISLRAAGNTEFTTQATLSLVSLHSHLADPLRRLRAIRDSAGSVKALARTARNVIPTDFPSIGSPWLLQSLAALYGKSRLAGAMPPIANVVISNVPGPPMPLYAAGARMTDYWPLSITEHGVGLNITVMSYAGTLGFGFTAARCAVPDARELTAALMEAFDELRAVPLKAAPGQAAPAGKAVAKKVAAKKVAAKKVAAGRASSRKPAAA